VDASAHIMTPNHARERTPAPTFQWGLCIFLLANALPVLAELPPVSFSSVATGIDAPTTIQNAGDGSGRLFLVQQGGQIRILRGGSVLSTPFLDIGAHISSGGERGLLGLAFPPGYTSNGHFYVSYTDPGGSSVVARYHVSLTNPDIADPSSETILLTQQQPFANHNGGNIQFGPDGYLYIGFGDGGSGGDPQGNGQNRRTFLGKILRIDVESELSAYRVPPTNPFVNDSTYLPEIWASGVRNPWRFSFDRVTGDLWIADVGQNRAEEIDFQSAGSAGGQNYGWNAMEGFQCFSQAGCDQTPYTKPILEYTHDDGNCSVTGGSVYRGSKSPGLRGTYIYADYCSGHIWGIRREGSQWVNQSLFSSGQQITTMGEDESGEIYAGTSSGVINIVNGGQAPYFTPSAVTNGASFVSGLVPGSAATVFAAGVLDAPGIQSAQSLPLPLSLANVSVTVGGKTAPLYAVANTNGVEQVNFQVPFDLTPAETTPVVVTRNGIASLAVNVPLLVYQPGIFTTNGQDAIAVFNDTNTLVTADKPAAAGDLLYFYAAGLGPVHNTPTTGAATPARPFADTTEQPAVTLNGQLCEFFYAGLAPNFAGIYQVNVRVPADLAPGNAALVISIGGATSPTVQLHLR
jgi:uncharacterized protein (TIGR03437 family)